MAKITVPQLNSMYQLRLDSRECQPVIAEGVPKMLKILQSQYYNKDFLRKDMTQAIAALELLVQLDKERN